MRLVTCSSFDGLVCGALLLRYNMVNKVEFTTRENILSGDFELTTADITCDLPFNDIVHLCFSNHGSVKDREIIGMKRNENLVVDPSALSTASVVCSYLGVSGVPVVEAVNKHDSAQYGHGEVQNPSGYTLLGLVLDCVSELDCSVSERDIVKSLMPVILDMSEDELLRLPVLQEAIAEFMSRNEELYSAIEDCGVVDGDVAVVDLRRYVEGYLCNKFLVYSVFPSAKYAIVATRSDDGVLVFCGKSIINKSGIENVGELMHAYGGIGRKDVGQCEFSEHDFEVFLPSLVFALNN